ncbi:MAG: hypothetical protein ACT4QD_11440 [Acidobacteriota bacterium]
MAHLWVRSGLDEWAVLPLGERLELDGQALPAAGVFESSEQRSGARRSFDQQPPATAALVCSTHAGLEIWTLLASPHRVTVNGIPVPNGVRVLSDRDELHVAGLEKAYFSTERLTRVEPCPASSTPLLCPRCRQEIAAAAPAVCCPGCGVWHHQEETLECWTYAERCALCPQPTSLNAGYQWTPEDL